MYLGVLLSLRHCIVCTDRVLLYYFLTVLPWSLAVIRFLKTEKIGFQLGLNVSRYDALFTYSRTLFPAMGPAIEKEQSANFVEDRGMCNRFFNEDCRLLSATLMQKLEM